MRDAPAAVLGRLIGPYAAPIRRCIRLARNRLASKRRIIGEGNALRCTGVTLSKIESDIEGNRNSIDIAEGCFLHGLRFHMRGSNHRVVIGRDCGFHRGGLIWFEDHSCKLEVGDNTTVEDAHIALTEPGSSITIGNDCMLAFDVDIRCGDSHSILDLASGERINYARDIVIGDHVWIAAHVQILKGVRIGSNSIVAIGSVVTGDIPPNCVAAGIPARVVRNAVTWDRRRLYQRAGAG